MSYIVEMDYYKWIPHDILALSYYYLGKHEKSLEHAQLAYDLSEEDLRLKNNLDLIKASVDNKPNL